METLAYTLSEDRTDQQLRKLCCNKSKSAYVTLPCNIQTLMILNKNIGQTLQDSLLY